MRWNGGVIGEYQIPTIGSNKGVYSLNPVSYYHSKQNWSLGGWEPSLDSNALAWWDPNDIGDDVTWTENTSLVFPDDVSSTIGAHNIIFKQSVTINKYENVTYPVGYIFRTSGKGGNPVTLVRAEDPIRPRALPYDSSGTNQNSGNWSWFDTSVRGSQWEFAENYLDSFQNLVGGAPSLTPPDANPSPRIKGSEGGIKYQGNQYIQIDSIADRLSCNINYTASCAIFIVAKITENPLASNDCLWFSGKNTFQYRAGTSGSWNPELGNGYSATGNIGSTSSKINGFYQIHKLVFDSSNNVIKISIDGTEVISNMSYPSSNHFDGSSQSFFLWSNAGQNSTMAGEMGDVTVTSDISSTNLGLHENYLANKWGITI